MNYYIIYFLLLLAGLSLNAQQDSMYVQYDRSVIEQRKFDNDNLDNYRSDSDFNYEVKKRQPTFLERAWNWFLRTFQKVLAWLFGNEAAVGIMAFIVRLLPYLIGAVVLFLLLKFFLKLHSKSSTELAANQSIVQLNKDEALIKNEDLNLLLEKAIAQHNYRLAIRYYYLLSLQKLSKCELIDWQQEKTNEDYIAEIKEQVLQDKFRANTYLYDFIWYGNFDINELDFVKAAKTFVAFNSSIK